MTLKVLSNTFTADEIGVRCVPTAFGLNSA